MPDIVPTPAREVVAHSSSTSPRGLRRTLSPWSPRRAGWWWRCWRWGCARRRRCCGSLPVSDTDIGAGALAQRIRAAIDTGWSGEVRAQGSLQVPLSGSTFGGVARLLGDRNQTCGSGGATTEHWRVDRINPTGETDQLRVARAVDPVALRAEHRAHRQLVPDPAARRQRHRPGGTGVAAAGRGASAGALPDPAAPGRRAQRRGAAPGARGPDVDDRASGRVGRRVERRTPAGGGVRRRRLGPSRP